VCVHVNAFVCMCMWLSEGRKQSGRTCKKVGEERKRSGGKRVGQQ